ncbi:patatin-like phospholipase family protein [Thalassomonas sp. M1454]|uniref:patatin-like phospholipase family protein n=1 Tax=Thalassomonas sp. M1454 TaxID=2594477 RepID=UPI00117C2740|nr:patatin-like phospholipase family protein [Thalassomonas sp. M1454]TRX56591.1 patatin-like phospholipase family protein [Thalassomonas sp. M1454]
MNNKQAENNLVLGGGGVTGIAWMTGILAGLEENGLDLSIFDSIVGTSAGSTVGAQISSSTSLTELFERQVDKSKQNHELVPKLNKLALLWKLLPALRYWKSPIKFRQCIGKIASKTNSVQPEKRLEVIHARLTEHNWPSGDLAPTLNIIAIDAQTGQHVIFNQDSDISLTNAVAASCAVPIVWPAVRDNNHVFVDGGIRSMNNADLITGCKKVLIISPTGAGKKGMPWANLQDEVALLKAQGAQVHVIIPDEYSLSEMGKNPLDPNKRTDSALAGKKQGLAIYQDVVDSLKL